MEDQRKPLREPRTSYFLFNTDTLRKNAQSYSKRNFKLYYSLKSCFFEGLEEILEPFVDGFTLTSSNHFGEINTKKDIHFVSPMIRDMEINVINEKGYSVSFNSFPQFKGLYKKFSCNIKKIIRVNPEISFLNDDRYDPCRNDLKIGVPFFNFNQDMSFYFFDTDFFNSLSLSTERSV